MPPTLPVSGWDLMALIAQDSSLFAQTLNQELEAPLPDFPIEHDAGDATRQGEG